MRTLKQSFSSPRQAVRFLKGVLPILHWVDSSRSEPASIVVRLDYPFKVPAIPHCHFAGIESMEAKFKTERLPAFQKAISGRFSGFLRRCGEAHFIFRAHTLGRKKRLAQYSISIMGSELLIRYVPPCGTENVEALHASYTRFLEAMGLEVTVVRTACGVAFKPRKPIRIETRQMDGVDLPSLVDCYVKDEKRSEWLNKIIHEWTQLELPLENPEFAVSFPYSADTKESTARKWVDELNMAGLPIKSARCELYYRINSALDVEGLICLKKVDRDDSTIEVTVARGVLPSALKGLITVTVRKSNLLVELHAQEAPDEDQFLEEARLVLKDLLQ